MTHIDNFTVQILDELSRYAIRGLKTELSIAGHNYTHRLSDSIDAKVLKKGITNIMMEDYGIDINEGYTAATAKKRLAAIGKGNYISELRDWFERKLGVDDEFSLAFARKTFEKHLEKGYKSRRSGLSQNQGFIDVVERALRKAGPSIVYENTDSLTIAIYNELLVLANEKFKITLKDVAGPTLRANFSDLF
jgi:hypothetical protein